MKFLKADAQITCFAPIDLKLANIYFYDGFRVTGCTNTNTEPLAETSIALTACGENVPVGCSVHFANDSTDGEYIVASRTTTGGTNEVQEVDLDGATAGTFTMTYGVQTTNAIAYDASNATIELELEALDGIGQGDCTVAAGDGVNEFKMTFTDDLAATPINGVYTFTFDKTSLVGGAGNAVKTVTTPGVVDGTTTVLVLESGLAEEVASGGAVTFTGIRLEVEVGEGNLTYSQKKPRRYIKNRGSIASGTVRDDDDEPMEVSFDFIWEWITGVSASDIPTVEDVLTQTGEADNWETTGDDACEPYCVDMVVNYDPDCGANNVETVTFPYFRYEELNHDIRESTISCTGKCKAIVPTIVRG